jgi:hypothetical protein
MRIKQSIGKGRPWPAHGAGLLILTLALALRTARLPALPVGLHYDEAANGILAAEIARGDEYPIFIAAYTGKEVLFFYWVALWMRLLGPTPLALRLGAATIGVATVAATVWAVRELLHGQKGARWVALLAAALLATSLQHLILSRYGFRAVSQPLMQALTVAALWRGLRLTTPGARQTPTGGYVWLVVAGILCGLTAYTYLAARLFPLPLGLGLLSLWGAEGRHRRARLGQMALFLLSAALALAPLGAYWLTHPGSFLNRTQQVAAQSWREAWHGLGAALGMLFLRGDPYVRFNLPPRPLLGPVMALLALVGGAVFLGLPPRPAREGRPARDPLIRGARVFLLACVPFMLLPSALAVGEITPSNLRAVGVLPFLYVLPAQGLWALAVRLVERMEGRRRPGPALLGALCVVALLVPRTLDVTRDYFRRWAPSAALYQAADGDLVDVARYLNRTDLTGTTPYVASQHYRHPTLAFLAEDYPAIRWLTGGETLVRPASGDGLLILPRSTSGARDWVEATLPRAQPRAIPPGPDGRPAFRAYALSAGRAMTPTRPLTAHLGHVARVVGYDVVGTPRSGERATVAVWWEVLAVPDRNFGPVVRLSDPWGFVWGETSPFHYPSEQWTVGELIVDRLAVPVAPGAPPGAYDARFGLYAAQTDTQLPRLDEGGGYAGRWVELPLELSRAEKAPSLDALPIDRELETTFDGLTLLGLDQGTTQARPGERLYLSLVWRAGTPAPPDHIVELTLGDTPLYRGAPVHGRYPTGRWRAGEVVVDRYDPQIPRDMAPGEHPLTLRVGGRAQALGTVTVAPVERTFDPPAPAHPLTATLDGRVALLGYDLTSPTVRRGEALTLTLYWRALDEMETDYTVFVHLLGPQGTMTAQRDRQPVDGSYPTSLWMAGEGVADRYTLTVPPQAPAGEHRLRAGMYVARTGARLTVDQTAQDYVPLHPIIVKE